MKMPCPPQRLQPCRHKMRKHKPLLSNLGHQKSTNDQALAPQPVKMREKALFFSSWRTRCSRGGGRTKPPAASSRKGRTGTVASFGGKGASAASCHTKYIQAFSLMIDWCSLAHRILSWLASQGRGKTLRKLAVGSHAMPQSICFTYQELQTFSTMTLAD